MVYLISTDFSKLKIDSEIKSEFTSVWTYAHSHIS